MGHLQSSPSNGAMPARRLAALALTPVGRDAELVGRVLAGDDLEVVSLPDAPGLCESVGRPDAGAVVLTGEALALPGIGALADALAGEPDWSELPFVLFVDAGWSAGDYLGLTDLLGGRRNVTVLERPIRPVAFRSVVRLAVEGRRQQLRVRDLLDRVQRFNDELQDRVDEQTVALRERAEQVEALARSLSEAELRERERIAQLLHDDVQQTLYGLKIHVDLLSRAAGDTDGLGDRVEGYVDEAINQTRLLATELHPPSLSDDGVGAALGWVADHARQRYGLTVHLDVTAAQTLPSPDVRALLTRVARELLFNVVKHAGTGEAWVKAWCDAEGCHLSVRDEGQGFEEPGSDDATGLGLSELRHRVGLAGGELEVESEPDEGTTVTALLPLDDEG
jgi:signal transduction histidine kinase